MAEGAIEAMTVLHPWRNTNEELLCTFLVDDIYNSQVRDEIADYVVLGEVLEHMSNPEKVVENSFKLLKPGGVLAISVPLEEANEPGAVDEERHLWSYSKQDIKNLVKPYSSKIKFKVLGSRYLPTYQYCWKQLLCWAVKK